MQRCLTAEFFEARAILQMVFRGAVTIKEARELIGISEPQAQSLNAFIASDAKAGAVVGYTMRFRRAVLEEFERLLAHGRASRI